MIHHRHRERSRSPSRHHARDSRSRSLSPRRHHSDHRNRRREERKPNALVQLPFGNRLLSKDDLQLYRPLFALYLDIQKHLFLDELAEDEIKGRWKSFFGKWNRAELAEGWYDPLTLSKAQARQEQSKESPPPNPQNRPPVDYRRHREGQFAVEEEDEDYGPSLPFQVAELRSHDAGPSIPTTSDLRERRELEAESAHEERDSVRAELRAERKADRKLQQQRLDEIAPRAEAGTRERQLEKKREHAASNKAFAEARERSPELGDNDLMGGGGDDLTDFKRIKIKEERKKNEREIRKEEVLRARAAEREERVKGMREKEDKTMAMLKELAKARFGGGAQS